MSIDDSDDGSGGNSEAGDTEGNRLVISPQRATGDIARILRLACIQRRDPSLALLAELSGVKLKRLRRFLENDPAERRSPSLAEALSIWSVLGAPAANGSLAAIGMTAEPCEAEAQRLTHAAADLFSDGAVLAQIAADGGIDSQEADVAERAANGVIARALTFLQASAKARAK